MEKEMLVTRLRGMQPHLREQGVTALYLFGSAARGEADEESDIDLMFDFDPETQMSFFKCADIRSSIEDVVHGKVDLVSRGGLRPRFLNRIADDLVQIF